MQNQYDKGYTMKIWIQFSLLFLIPLTCYSQNSNLKIYPGADVATPSLSQYESWINNTNEGSTEAQTLANLDFFRWLKDEYEMLKWSSFFTDKLNRIGYFTTHWSMIRFSCKMVFHTTIKKQIST